MPVQGTRVTGDQTRAWNRAWAPPTPGLAHSDSVPIALHLTRLCETAAAHTSIPATAVCRVLRNVGRHYESGWVSSQNQRGLIKHSTSLTIGQFGERSGS